ncbi:YbaB/EbfC family nucleoid-associated protein [Mycoplasma bradburyae]|uniref:Nucleoid-associated protein LNO68_03190 n=1 Tax=Mycoplasma bradburyae TaxID=2963128 RepID=A0AAW6HRA2_9MOLU|nr:YbaB/EbfC family nucleoid-associated protein [Mycoplasma bradburyae]MDC4163574.1 YbaB/EbfC family nucleoid-associated protein [Mycoplasma bradburyae]MDC4182172.1 YbaB/EbfC family nucleoid-associated protein [Mycoplasma bradburyae]MDC4182937.1 YbaB/EbfC family nucleoid-associated protein [Mycoplasma bradburyae]MDC4183620.1 YbaB/EbfC family nucleoid-associated protein [Mycoplasma bradburyae]MDC4184358.1 YbaB/EbfC family nucleoid-associated protein [Mycoplasma bradburyae]
MNFQNLANQMKKMQREMEKKIAEFEEKEYEYEYKKLIKSVIKGNLKIVKIEINKDLIDPEDPATLQEMVAEAINEAITDLEKKKDELTNTITPPINFPGFR